MMGLTFASPSAQSADPATELREDNGTVQARPPRSALRVSEIEPFDLPPHLPAPRRSALVAATLALHLATLAALVLVPLFSPDWPLDEGHDPLRVLLYDPPPPPPPPLPKGSATGGRERSPAPEVPRPVEALPVPVASALTAPVEKPAPLDDSVGLTVEAPGSPTGSESGVSEGMEEGVPGGVVGGVPGGVVGGVIGGTGTGPVPVRDVDRPLRLLRQVRPAYPGEAFVKKVEGTVVIEILVDERGRVVRTRILRSVALLDAAAVEAVRQWVFAPAQKQGRPVATIAVAPVTFRIF